MIEQFYLTLKWDQNSLSHSLKFLRSLQYEKRKDVGHTRRIFNLWIY